MMCVEALRFGMSYDEFWHGDPKAYGYMRDAWVKKQRERTAELDFLAWNTGRYVTTGLSIVLEAAFSKGGTKHEYPEVPEIALELDERAKKEYEQRKLMKIYQRFTALVQARNKEMGGADG
jgi:hypothetical protein